MTDLLQSVDFVLSSAFSAGNDSASVAHPTAGRSREASNERYHRFRVGSLSTATICLQPRKTQNIRQISPSKRPENILDSLTYRIVLHEVLGGIFFGHPANLSDQDDPLRFRIFEEHFQTIDEVRAVERIATDADAERLPKTDLRENFVDILNHDCQSEGS